MEQRVVATDKAKVVIAQLRSKYGELIFHQSAGCCDGSVALCLEKSDFVIGARDICLGEIVNCQFYIAAEQFTYYKNTQLIIDVATGRASGFSLEASLGLRFITLSRLLSDEEFNKLAKLELNKYCC